VVSGEESIMRDWDRSPGLERRAFLGGATAASAASVLSPLAQAATPAASSAPGAAVTALTTQHLVGSAVNLAYAVKAGWIDENGSGRFNVLETETREPFRAPCAYDGTGLPLHSDGQSVFNERFFLDKADPNISTT
jgi:hypothetical protein